MNLLDALMSQPLVALFATIAAGLALGQVRVAGVSLEASGVLFVALLVGHLGYQLPGVGDVGLVLFVYCVGLTAGPGFFRAFVRQGKDLALLGVILVLCGAATTAVFAWAAEVPIDLAAGIFGGAMTSTPALAAAMEALGQQHAGAPIGFGLAYPFGVVGVILFVQLLPRLLGQNLDLLSAQTPGFTERKSIGRVLVEVRNPAFAGRAVTDVKLLRGSGCVVSRVLEGQRLVPLRPDHCFQVGQHVLLIGPEESLEALVEVIGQRSQARAVMDTENERMQIVVTSPKLVGQSLRQLDLWRRRGIIVTRVSRFGFDFVPRPDTVVNSGDQLTVVGEPASLQRFAADAGHRAKLVDQTDLVSLGVGVTLGVVLGMIPVKLPGSTGGASEGITLGLAGGPLLVGLILGHFGRVGRVIGYVPRASRLVLMEIGLALFLASAGVRAGGRIAPVLAAHGPTLFAMGLAVTLLPMIVGYFVATFWFRMPLLEVLGGVCGGMTSTPGLGAITSRTDSDIPVVSYAAAYPAALILMTLAAQALVSIFR